MKKTRGIIGIIAIILFVGSFIYVFAGNLSATRDEASVTPIKGDPATLNPNAGGTSGTTTGTGTGTTSGSTGSYTLAQVATHNSATSCWTTINGGVYDVTSWINQHPGGRQAILSLCGVDGSAAFNQQHGGQARPEQELASFKIGTLTK